jgi:hypothetical protein
MLYERAESFAMVQEPINGSLHGEKGFGDLRDLGIWGFGNLGDIQENSGDMPGNMGRLTLP